MMTPIKQGLPPRDLAHFRRLAEKHLPGQEQKIEDSLEIVGQLVDQGIGPLEPLSVENRIKVLKLAIETVPPRTDSTWMGQLAWWSLKEVDRVRTSEEVSNTLKIHLNGETAYVGMSPPEDRPGLVEAYSDYAEIRDLTLQGGSYAHNLGVDARNGLNYELNHFHQDENEVAQFRTLLGVIGSPSLATLGVHRMRRICVGEDREKAIERMGQLRPGLENSEYHDVLPLAASVKDKIWDRLTESDSYSGAIVTAKLLHSLNLDPEEHWGEFQDFSKRLLDLKVERRDLNKILTYVTDNYEKLRVGLASDDPSAEETVMGTLMSDIEKSWLAPPEHNQSNAYVQSRERTMESLQGLAMEAAVAYARTGLAEPSEADTSILLLGDEIQIGDFSLEIREDD